MTKPVMTDVGKRLLELSKSIDEKIANFSNLDISDIDPQMLKLAQKALDAIEARKLKT